MSDSSNADPNPPGVPPPATADTAPPATADTAPPVDRGDEEERTDVIEAMAVYSADGQVDDASGGDAAAARLQADEIGQPELDREPHGPS